jgi:hypothetical protein
MRSLFSLFICTVFLSVPLISFAAETYPSGGISIQNRTNTPITAQVSTFGKVTLEARQVKNVAYSTLSQACSEICRTQFYVNNVPAGSAVINTVTGKLMERDFARNKVVTIVGSNNVLRTVIIK